MMSALDTPFQCCTRVSRQFNKARKGFFIIFSPQVHSTRNNSSKLYWGVWQHPGPNPALNWNLVAGPAPALAFLSAPGSTALLRCESCRFLTLQTFGPWPANLRSAEVESGRYNLREQVEVITEILDALVGKLPAEMSPGKLFLHVASWFERLCMASWQRLGMFLSAKSGCLGVGPSFLATITPSLKKEFINGNPVLRGHEHHHSCCIQGQRWKAMQENTFKKSSRLEKKQHVVFIDIWHGQLCRKPIGLYKNLLKL